MPSISDIPWLRPARTLQAIEAGASAGAHRASLETQANEAASRNALQAQEQAQQAQQGAARIAAEQQRTQAEAVQAKMQLDAQTKIQQQQTLRADQQLKIEGARKDAEFGLRQQQLKQAKDVADAKARDAALLFADHAAFAQEIQSGTPPERAIWNHPRMMTSSTITATMKPPPKMTDSQFFASSPIMQKEEADTLSQIQSGVPELKAIQDHPTLLENPPYAQKWGARFNAAKSRDERNQAKAEAAQAKADQPPNVSALANRRASLTAKLGDSTQKLTPEIKQAYKKEIFKIDTTLNGGKPPPPSEEDISHLKSDPSAKDKFDEVFGEGEADKILKPAE